ncbi:hypothetical protein VTK26DRAFT_6532 [Humicola hyalothermophila]
MLRGHGSGADATRIAASSWAGLLWRAGCIIWSADRAGSSKFLGRVELALVLAVCGNLGPGVLVTPISTLITASSQVIATPDWAGGAVAAVVLASASASASAVTSPAGAAGAAALVSTILAVSATDAVSAAWVPIAVPATWVAATTSATIVFEAVLPWMCHFRTGNKDK